MGRLLRLLPERRGPDTWDVDRFMATTFIDSVRAYLVALGSLHSTARSPVSSRQRAVMALEAAAELMQKQNAIR